MLAVAAVGIGGVACGGGGGTSAPAPKSTAAVPVPAAADFGDSGLVMCLRLRAPSQLVDRVGFWASQIDPAHNADSMRRELLPFGIDPAPLRAGENLSFFAWLPPDLNSEPGWAVLIPADAASSTVATARALSGAESAEQLGKCVMIASDAATREKAMAIAGALEAMQAESLGADLQIDVNIESLMAQYGPMVRTQIEQLKSVFAMATGMASAQGPDAAKQMEMTKRMLDVELDATLDAAEQIRTLTVCMDLPKDNAELSVIVRPRAGTGMAGFFDKKPMEAPNVARYIAGDRLIQSQVSVADMKTIGEVYIKYLTMILPPDEPERLQKFQEMFDAMADQGRLDYALAMDFLPGQGMQGEGVIQVKDPERLMELTRDSIVDLKTYALSEIAGGIETETTIRQAAREVLGQPVDQIEITMSLPAGMNSQQKMVMQMMMGSGPITAETMRMGSAVLVSWGQPIDNLAQRVSDGGGGSKLQAQELFEPGGCSYMDMKLLQYVSRFLTTMMPILPDLSAMVESAPPLSVAGYHQNGVAYYRLKVPVGIPQAIRKVIESFERQSMSGAPASPGF
jgi:hypothetical protein